MVNVNFFFKVGHRWRSRSQVKFFWMSGKPLPQGTYMRNMKALSERVQNLWPMLKLSNKQTDRAKTICPRYHCRGNKNEFPDNLSMNLKTRKRNFKLILVHQPFVTNQQDLSNIFRYTENFFSLFLILYFGYSWAVCRIVAASYKILMKSDETVRKSVLMNKPCKFKVFGINYAYTCLSLVILWIIDTLSDTHLLTSTFLASILLGPAEHTGAEVLAESWVDCIVSYGLLLASDGNL